MLRLPAGTMMAIAASFIGLVYWRRRRAQPETLQSFTLAQSLCGTVGTIAVLMGQLSEPSKALGGRSLKAIQSPSAAAVLVQVAIFALVINAGLEGSIAPAQARILTSHPMGRCQAQA